MIGAARRKENKDHDRKKEAKKAVKVAEQLLEQRTTELNNAREGALQYKRDEQIDPGSKNDDSQSGTQAAGNRDSKVDIGWSQGTAQDDNIQDDGHHGTCKPACDTEVSAEHQQHQTHPKLEPNDNEGNASDNKWDPIAKNPSLPHNPIKTERISPPVQKA